MSRRSRTTCVVCAAAALAAAAGVNARRALAGAGASPRTIVPAVRWSGAQSRIQDTRYLRVSTKEAWAELWERHVGGKPVASGDPGDVLPEIDFAKWMVIAVFQGSGWNSNGVRVESLQEHDDRLLLRFDDKSYQTSGPNGGGVRVTAFGLFVLPRSGKPVVLEENTQGLIGKPPKWTRRARLDALKS